MQAELRERGLLALCTYCFLSFFSPSESFLFTYLQDNKHFTESQLVNLIYPVWTYGLYASLLLLLPLSCLFGHKSIIVLGAAARFAAGLIVVVISPGTVWLMQADQLCFSLFFAVKVAIVPAFVFKALPASAYQWGISLTRSCVLVGNALSAFLGQALVAGGTQLTVLVFITCCAHAMGFLCTLALPRAKALASNASLVSAGAGIQSPLRPSVYANSWRADCSQAAPLIWSMMVGPAKELFWLFFIWYAGPTAAQELLLTYAQALFQAAVSDQWLHWSGSVFGAAYTVGSIALLIPAHPPIEQCLRGHLSLLAVGSCLFCAAMLALLAAAASDVLTLPALVFYSIFICAHVTFELIRTFCGAQLGVLMDARGCRNFLVVLVLRQFSVSTVQSLLQALATSTSRKIGVQMLVSAGFVAALAVAFTLVLTVKRFKSGCRGFSREGGWQWAELEVPASECQASS